MITTAYSRAFPHSKAQPAGFGATPTPQLRRLALSNPSIWRKRHESAMSIVMGSLTDLLIISSVDALLMLAVMCVQDAVQERWMILDVLHEVGGLLLGQVPIADGLIERVLDSIYHNGV